VDMRSLKLCALTLVLLCFTAAPAHARFCGTVKTSAGNYNPWPVYTENFRCETARYFARRMKCPPGMGPLRVIRRPGDPAPYGYRCRDGLRRMAVFFTRDAGQ
jgi:hypothetical protein